MPKGYGNLATSSFRLNFPVSESRAEDKGAEDKGAEDKGPPLINDDFVFSGGPLSLVH